MTQRLPWARRDFLRAVGASGAAAAASAVWPRHVAAQAAAQAAASEPRSAVSMRSVIDPIKIIDGTDVHTLAMRALDAAKSAGAQYADVRLTRSLTQSFFGGGTRGGLPFASEGETFGVGVRALVNGIWGFAASSYWELDDVVRLAREAALQAKTNARGEAPAEPWTKIPTASGSWATPIEVDPFTVTIEEKGDLLTTWSVLGQRKRIDNTCRFSANFTREERAVATSEGAYFTQTCYTTGGEFRYYRWNIYGPREGNSAAVDGLETTAAGWELFTNANIPAQMTQLYDAADPAIPKTPSRPGEIGRYDVVFDAATMASLTGHTIGTAAQVDRAIGYEANAGGTSYMGPDPLALLGTLQVASPLVTVTANRSMPRGLATVKWDDEGVAPEDFTLVRNGTLVDYQTTREQAQWLAPWYQKQGVPIRSHGCAGSESGLEITMQHMPNLVLEPGPRNVDFADLVAETKRGLAVMGARIDTDFQGRTGVGSGEVREIVNGKLGSVLTGLAFLFNTTQLWKNVTALGGQTSARQFAAAARKGQPEQRTSYSTRAVPATLTNVDFINPARRA